VTTEDRAAFLAAVDARAAALLDAAAWRGPEYVSAAEYNAAALRSNALELADQVDRHNASSPVRPVTYTDAVVIDGDGCLVVTDADLYRRHRVWLEAQAGDCVVTLTAQQLLTEEDARA